MPTRARAGRPLARARSVMLSKQWPQNLCIEPGLTLSPLVSVLPAWALGRAGTVRGCGLRSLLRRARRPPKPRATGEHGLDRGLVLISWTHVAGPKLPIRSRSVTSLTGGACPRAPNSWLDETPGHRQKRFSSDSCTFWLSDAAPGHRRPCCAYVDQSCWSKVTDTELAYRFPPFRRPNFTLQEVGQKLSMVFDFPQWNCYFSMPRLFGKPR